MHCSQPLPLVLHHPNRHLGGEHSSLFIWTNGVRLPLTKVLQGLSTMPPPWLDLISVLSLCFVKYGLGRIGKGWGTQASTPAALMNHPCSHSSTLGSGLSLWILPNSKTMQPELGTSAPLLKTSPMSEKQRNPATLRVSTQNGKEAQDPGFPKRSSSYLAPRLLDQDLSDSHISEVLTLLHILTRNTVWYKHSGGHLAIIALQKFKNHLFIDQVLPTCEPAFLCTVCFRIIITALRKPRSHNNHLIGV